MTAFYAVTEFVGEQRVHGIARFAGKIALTRYTILPILAVFFLTNPMAYTFGTFLDEKYKPAFYDSAGLVRASRPRPFSALQPRRILRLGRRAGRPAAA